MPGFAAIAAKDAGIAAQPSKKEQAKWLNHNPKPRSSEICEAGLARRRAASGGRNLLEHSRGIFKEEASLGWPVLCFEPRDKYGYGF